MNDAITKRYRVAWLLVAAAMLAGAPQAEARWKITRLVPKPKGTLAVVALNDNGDALTSFTPTGFTSSLGAWAGAGSFRTFNDCGGFDTGTTPTALGVGGWNVGICGIAGYVREPNGVVVSISACRTETFPAGVQNGLVVGSCNPAIEASVGFVYNVVENQTQLLSPPESNWTEVTGINAQNVIWGWYEDVQGHEHGFTYQGGVYTFLDQTGYSFLMPTGVNKSGLLAGDAVDASGLHHAFVLLHGTLALANLPNEYESSAVALNNAGQVAGNYTTIGGTTASFLWSTATNNYALLDAPPRGNSIVVNAINTRGQVAGSYQVGNKQVAFVATCKGKLCK